MAIQTQASLRDDIRRMMSIVPPIDDGSGGAGAAPSYWPDPSNNVINMALDYARCMVNRVVRLGPFVDFQIPVNACASWKRGVYWVTFSNSLPPGAGVIHAGEVEEVLWTNAAGNTNRLESQQYYGISKGYQAYQVYKPDEPQQFVSSGAAIGLLPPPSAAGTLTVTVTSGIDALHADTDVPQYIPDDYEYVLTYISVMILSARDAQSIEAQTRFAYFKDLATTALLQLYQWKNGYDEAGIEVVRNVLQMSPQNTMQMNQPVQQQQVQGQ